MGISPRPARNGARNILCLRPCRAARSLGTALITPNLAALIAKRGESRRVGAALGVHNAANSLGQASNPLTGSALFIWQMNAPYLLTGALLVAVDLEFGESDGQAARGQARVMNDAVRQ